MSTPTCDFLNLLSNAFKFTLHGKSRYASRQSAHKWSSRCVIPASAFQPTNSHICSNASAAPRTAEAVLTRAPVSVWR